MIQQDSAEAHMRGVRQFTVLISIALALAAGPAHGDPTTRSNATLLGMPRPPQQDAPAPPELLPLPPRQNQPWTPPRTKLPAGLVSATELLFKQGMADPRGGEYCAVKIHLYGDVRGDTNEPMVHGWLLPAKGATQRFAVCWNGVLYPVKSVGRAADLASDVAAAIAGNRADRQAANLANGKNTGTRVHLVTEGEIGAVSVMQMNDVKVCLLLRLGETALAEQYWEQYSLSLPQVGQPATQSGAGSADDLYLELAHDWAWMLFDRAVTAHESGNDLVSLDAAEKLAAAWPQIEQTAAAKHDPRPDVIDPDTGQEIADPPYLTFLNPLPALVADERRRADEGTIHRVLSHPDEYKDKAKRIAGLIRDLEDDSAVQLSVPGYPAVASHLVALALAKEGTDAIEPVLQCLAHDERLTRSVRGRWFFEERNFIPVSEVAFDVLCRILEVNDFGPHTHDGWNPNDRAASVAEIRAYWQRYRGLSASERWYRTLADDKAGPDRWLESIKNIVQPVDRTVYSGWTEIPPRVPDRASAMAGESLRNKKQPNVTELMIRRIPEIAADQPGTSYEIFRADDATKAALALARWDRSAAISAMQAQLSADADVAAQWAKKTNQDDALVADQAYLYAGLENVGDRSACQAYARWIRKLSVPDMPDRDLIFLPLWQEPDDPDIQSAAQWLFNDPASPWYALCKVHTPWNGASSLVSSPLLGLPAFQTNLLRNLQDHTPMKETDDFGGMVPPIDPLAPKPGEKRLLRVCDWYASEFACADGTPAFEQYWPQANRDAAIKRQIEFLHTWGRQFGWSQEQQAMFDDSEPRAHVAFPQRNRPATDGEAKAHTAIFSLGSDNVRLLPIDPFPQQATWKTLKQFVTYGLAMNPTTGKEKWVQSYDQDGQVWQAEERLENGKWHRYYGFVGHHIIAMVPAEEIELFTPNKSPAMQP